MTHTVSDQLDATQVMGGNVIDLDIGSGPLVYGMPNLVSYNKVSSKMLPFQYFFHELPSAGDLA